MNNINSYIILNRQTRFIVKLFVSISLIMFASLILVLNMKYEKYYQTLGQVINNDNNYKLIINLSPYKLNIIKNNDSVIIDKFKYNYKINSISKDYIISGDLNNYIQITLDVNLNEKDKINNNILEVKFLESNKKLFYYLKEYLKEGVKK